MFALWMVTVTLGADPAPPRAIEVARLRRPVAAVPLDGGRRLAVAHQRTGSITILDIATGVVEQELDVGARLESLAGPTPAGLLLAVDSTRHELIALGQRENKWSVRGRSTVVPWPHSVVIDRAGRRAFIAGLWSHRWQVVPLDAWTDGAAHPVARPRSPIELPFAPRLQSPLPDGSIVVADAFGGHMAVLDVESERVVAVAQLPLHNIRGLNVSPDQRFLVLAHQALDERLPITRDAIVAGRLMRNGVSRIPLDALRGDSGRWNELRRFQTLDVTGPESPQGAGDPAGMAWSRAQHVVALAGMDEAAIRDEPSGASRRVPVGARPTVVVPLVASGHVAVVNTLSDSVSVIDPTGALPPRTLSFGPPAPLGPRDRGERLFFDARLSAGGFLSCHSCHVDGHSNGLLADTLGDDTFGAPKRTPTLLGTGFTYRWGWNGLQASLHDQVRKSIAQTMHGDDAAFQRATDIVAFLHSLPPPPPVAPQPRDEEDRVRLEIGKRVFESRGCGNCHIPPLVYASHESYDVGLSDEKGLKKFNPPSLRGVSQSFRLLHDNRAASLEAVFREHLHPNDLELSDQEIESLGRFLRSL